VGLKPKIIKPSDFINPLLSKKSVEQEKFEKFQVSYGELLKVNKTESEEHQKNAVRDFLVHSFGYEINTKARIDWAIFKNSKVEVLIEAKRLDNLSEMVTKDDLNRKAFHEAILYFMQERADGNIHLKHIIILTAFSWFVFDAKDFERLFWQNKQIKKIYTEFKNPSLLGDKTKDFYENLAKELPKFQANLLDDLEIECAYFNLQEPHKPKDLLAIYKLLSADTLLKEFNPNDANTLNREFYNELLYILGLEETKQGSKKVIAKATASQEGSFYENIANKLMQYGISNDFETIIKLIIIWINRILFLKLLESQIVAWNKNKEFKFLHASKINDYDKLEMLFFEILAKRPQMRKHKEFDYIPYLNSSLFEIHEYETKYLTVSNLEDDAKINYYPKTVLKDEKRARKSGQASTLAYLFEFLDAYDFGSTSDAIANESKSLINASVLGLIFEKINGYKDGSFYTPSFITMYMARESLQKSIIERFNAAFAIEALSFEELRNYCDKHNYKNEFLEKANKIIDSLSVCDPAVGSGHFLVSVLNEIIYIKHQLGLFNLRGLKIELINDELLVKLEDEWFEYTKPKDFESPNHKVQKMLFLEKQRIIENQLFGVDINPNSSQITKLRLWIELLKNSYYDANYELVTLPNIDINIKTGNSLISRFDLKDEIKMNNVKQEIKNYKQRVKEYKENLGTKKEVLESIESLKNKFRLTLKAEYKVTKERNEKLREYVADFGHEGLNDDLLLTAIKNKYGHKQSLFGDTPDTKKQAKLLEELAKLEKQIDEIEKGKIYEDAFEWRFEFPEVLDEDGNFVGFDIVIGNPPYVQLDKLYQTRFSLLSGNQSAYIAFFEQGFKILRESGTLSFIVPTTFLSADNYLAFRDFLITQKNIDKIIKLPYDIFEAYVDTAIVFYRNNLLINNSVKLVDFKIKNNEEIDFNNNEEMISQSDFLKFYNHRIVFGNVRNLLEKYYAHTKKLSEIAEINRGTLPPKENDLTTVDNENAMAWFDGQIYRYEAKESDKDIYVIPETLGEYKNKELFKVPKIMIRQLISRQFRLQATYSEGGFVFKKNLYAIYNIKEEFSQFYILALLNSSLYSFISTKGNPALQRDDFPALSLADVRNMVIPDLDINSQQPFIDLADQILTLKKENPHANTSELEAAIDTMVYKLYDLSDEEIKIVEEQR
jgi:hypothetical protein